MQVRVLLAAAVLGTWCSSAAVGWAQLPSPELEASAERVGAARFADAPFTPISAVAIPERAREVDAKLRAVRQLERAPELDRVVAELPGLREEMAGLSRASELGRVGWRRRQLADLLLRWLGLRVQLADWLSLVKHRADTLDALKQAAHALRQTWTITLTVLREDSRTPQAALAKAELVLRQLDEAEALLRVSVDAVFTLRQELNDSQDQLEANLARVQSALAHYTERAFQRTGMPIWAFVASSSAGALPPLRTHGERIVLGLRAFWRDYAERLPLDLPCFGLFLLSALVLAKRARERAGAAGRTAPAVLRTPLAAASLVAFVIACLIYVRATFAAFDVFVLASLVPLYRIVPQLVRQPALAGPVRWLLAPLALHRVCLLLALDSPWHEPAMLLAAALFWLALYRIQRTSQLAQAASLLERGLALFVRVALFALAIALLAGLTGYEALLSYLIEGFTASTYWLLLSVVLTRVLHAFLDAALESRRLSRLSSMTQHGALIQQRALGAANLLGAMLWCGVTLYGFGLTAPLAELSTEVLGKRAELGAWSLSLGDLTHFSITIYVSALVARLLSFALEYDVLPALGLERGGVAAISRLSGYLVLTFGFVLAVGAAGVDMSRMALLASALSIGIGFGMQELVNNFVSGLMLIFERPVRVGDVVQFGELTGEVRTIGIRSSTLRTYQGAEVIVPNTDLISNEVINWTLSDLMRRIEIPLSLDKDFVPEHVIELVLSAVADIPGIERFPAPVCILTSLAEGDLNFELRIWARSEDWPLTRGAALLAIQRSLSAAGMPPPFPEFSAHLRSLDAGFVKAAAATPSRA
jgi:small-conductance mechanosensitive channel